jgi:hypothetical protein
MDGGGGGNPGFDPVDTTSPQANRNATGWRRVVHLSWLRMPLGILKLVEVVVVLLALAIMGSIRNVAGTGYSAIEFFYFVYSAAFIMGIITILLYVFNLYHRLPAIMTCNVVWAVMCGVCSFLMMAASAACVDKFDWNDTILAGGAFGFIAMFLFLFETAFYVINWRNKGMFANSGVESLVVGVAFQQQPSPVGGQEVVQY